MLTLYGDNSWFANSANRVVDLMLDFVWCFDGNSVCDFSDIWFCVKYDVFRIIQDLRIL